MNINVAKINLRNLISSPDRNNRQNQSQSSNSNHSTNSRNQSPRLTNLNSTENIYPRGSSLLKRCTVTPELNSPFVKQITVIESRLDIITRKRSPKKNSERLIPFDRLIASKRRVKAESTDSVIFESDNNSIEKSSIQNTKDGSKRAVRKIVDINQRKQSEHVFNKGAVVQNRQAEGLRNSIEEKNEGLHSDQYQAIEDEFLVDCDGGDRQVGNGLRQQVYDENLSQLSNMKSINDEINFEEDMEKSRPEQLQDKIEDDSDKIIDSEGNPDIKNGDIKYLPNQKLMTILDDFWGYDENSKAEYLSHHSSRFLYKVLKSFCKEKKNQLEIVFRIDNYITTARKFLRDTALSNINTYIDSKHNPNIKFDQAKSIFKNAGAGYQKELPIKGGTQSHRNSREKRKNHYLHQFDNYFQNQQEKQRQQMLNQQRSTINPAQTYRSNLAINVERVSTAMTRPNGLYINRERSYNSGYRNLNEFNNKSIENSLSTTNCAWVMNLGQNVFNKGEMNNGDKYKFGCLKKVNTVCHKVSLSKLIRTKSNIAKNIDKQSKQPYNKFDSNIHVKF